ncbi:MAG: hypothetical protein AB1765_08245 [Candidatus Hydrogenedentota bacterium]
MLLLRIPVLLFVCSLVFANDYSLDNIFVLDRFLTGKNIDVLKEGSNTWILYTQSKTPEYFTIKKNIRVYNLLIKGSIVFKVEGSFPVSINYFDVNSKPETKEIKPGEETKIDIFSFENNNIIFSGKLYPDCKLTIKSLILEGENIRSKKEVKEIVIDKREEYYLPFTIPGPDNFQMFFNILENKTREGFAKYDPRLAEFEILKINKSREYINFLLDLSIKYRNTGNKIYKEKAGEVFSILEKKNVLSVDEYTDFLLSILLLDIPRTDKVTVASKSLLIELLESFLYNKKIIINLDNELQNFINRLINDDNSLRYTLFALSLIQNDNIKEFLKHYVDDIVKYFYIFNSKVVLNMEAKKVNISSLNLYLLYQITGDRRILNFIKKEELLDNYRYVLLNSRYFFQDAENIIKTTCFDILFDSSILIIPVTDNVYWILSSNFSCLVEKDRITYIKTDLNSQEKIYLSHSDDNCRVFVSNDLFYIYFIKEKGLLIYYNNEVGSFEYSNYFSGLSSYFLNPALQRLDDKLTIKNPTEIILLSLYDNTVETEYRGGLSIIEGKDWSLFNNEVGVIEGRKIQTDARIGFIKESGDFLLLSGSKLFFNNIEYFYCNNIVKLVSFTENGCNILSTRDINFIEVFSKRGFFPKTFLNGEEIVFKKIDSFKWQYLDNERSKRQDNERNKKCGE